MSGGRGAGKAAAAFPLTGRPLHIQPRLLLLLALFFGSGASGLVYQVLWLRLLSLVFGVTVYAASTVLAAFMAGLALGSALAPRVVRRLPPLVAFGAAEILIGVSALATPLALDAASVIYEPLYRVADGSLAVLTGARLVTSFVVLLLPTMLMGMTLPVLSASTLVRGAGSGSGFGSRVSALYAVNTAGAVTGAVVTGFLLIGTIGITRSFQLAAFVNVLVGVVALALARRANETVSSEGDASGPHLTAAGHEPVLPARAHVVSPRVLTLVAWLSGAASLALEIVWFRMLVVYVPATTYAFTTMLACVLIGIAGGSAIAAAVLRRWPQGVLQLARLQFFTALAVPASASIMAAFYRSGARMGDWQASAAIIPVSVLMGMSFPLLLHLAASHVSSSATGVAARVARLYSANVAGAIVGSLVGGFVLLPALGVRRALIALSCVYAASALLLLWSLRQRMAPLWFVPGAIALALLIARVPDPFTAAHARRHGSDMREFWREEGVQTAVSVHLSQFRRSLYLDGLHQANDTAEMVRLHRIIGHLPMVLHPDPRRVLVIGMGGGATPGAVSQYENARVQVVELSGSVRRAASWFSHINYDLLNQPRVRIRVDDGRNFLRFSGEQFDVITADIIQPIHAGAGNLYSREYFTLVRQALAPGGIALQWIGHREPSQYLLIMRTFLSVFPEATLWFDGNLMVGSLTPLRVLADTLARARRLPLTAAALDEVGLTSQEMLNSWYTAGPNEMRRFVGNGPLLTDDRPLVEYHRSLPRDTRPLDLSTLRGELSDLHGPPD